MDDTDDLEDARSREDNRRYVEDAERTKTVAGRWIVFHPFRATTGESVMAFLGGILLLAFVAALVLKHFGVWPGHR